jgi:uncharacterized protein (TIGR02001 family)
LLLAGCGASLVSVPAAAQVVSASVSVESDFRLRGYSYSGGRPVASARIGVDDSSGLYADSAGTVVFTEDEGARFLAYQVDGGFVTRVGDRWTLDIGLAHNEVRAAYRGAFPYPYTEGYVGATRGAVSAYVFVSPNHYRSGFWTIYGQIEASLSPAANWHVTGHLGSLRNLDRPRGIKVSHYTYYDWRLSAAREFGRFEIHAAVSGGSPGRQYYYGSQHSRTAVTAGASVSF